MSSQTQSLSRLINPWRNHLDTQTNQNHENHENHFSSYTDSPIPPSVTCAQCHPCDVSLSPHALAVAAALRILARITKCSLLELDGVLPILQHMYPAIGSACHWCHLVNNLDSLDSEHSSSGLGRERRLARLEVKEIIQILINIRSSSPSSSSSSSSSGQHQSQQHEKFYIIAHHPFARKLFHLSSSLSSGDVKDITSKQDSPIPLSPSLLSDTFVYRHPTMVISTTHSSLSNPNNPNNPSYIHENKTKQDSEGSEKSSKDFQRSLTTLRGADSPDSPDSPDNADNASSLDNPDEDDGLLGLQQWLGAYFGTAPPAPTNSPDNPNNPNNPNNPDNPDPPLLSDRLESLPELERYHLLLRSRMVPWVGSENKKSLDTIDSANSTLQSYIHIHYDMKEVRCNITHKDKHKKTQKY